MKTAKFNLIVPNFTGIWDSLIHLTKPWSAKLTSIEGIEERPASHFIAELGDPSIFHSPKSLVSLAGIAAQAWCSGASEKRPESLKKKESLLANYCLLHGSLLYPQKYSA